MTRSGSQRVFSMLDRRMDRRKIITFLGAVAAAWPLALRAQARLPTVGILALGNPPVDPFVEGLREGLLAVGYSGLDFRSSRPTANEMMSWSLGAG